MTCKASFFNSIRETMKHHIASTFAVVFAFFIQFLVFFLQIQNLASEQALNTVNNMGFLHEDLLHLTQPNLIYWIPVIFAAVILAFDYFRYLHSKKQMDFYESLPMKRNVWFLQKAVLSYIVFLVPFLACKALECLLLYAYNFRQSAYFINILWNVIIMILLFSIAWITAVLAMVMTGHPVIAAIGFGIFCGYSPVILRYIYPVYANAFFETYVTSSNYYSSGFHLVTLNDFN